MKEFEVVDLRPGASKERLVVSGRTPAQVVSDLFGEPVVRSGASRNLLAKCYFDNGDGNRNMVRFYRTVVVEMKQESAIDVA